MRSSNEKNQMNVFENTPGLTNEIIKSKFLGMSQTHVANTMSVLADITQGHMPKDMRFLYAEGKRVGMTEAQTRQVAKEIINYPNPEARVYAYLTGNGRNFHAETDRIFQEVMEILPHYVETDITDSLDARLAANTQTDDNWRKQQINAIGAEPAKGKSNIDRIGEHSADQKNLRDLIKAQMGELRGEESFETKQNRVHVAQLRLADRIESGVALNPNADLKTTVRDSYDLHHVNDAAKDVGFGDFIEGSREVHEANNGHMSDDFDVTSDLPRD